MPFTKSVFIKPDEIFDNKREDYAPMFRKKFIIDEKIESATLSVCGLGYGYYYINKKEVSSDLFTAPVSDYSKTLWYNSYDISDKLCMGENIFAVICGNGWYNEALETGWGHNEAKWRDFPKFILSLEVNGKVVLVSDNSWVYTLDTPYIFNQLRQGEHYDSRKYKEDWASLDFDDSDWKNVRIDENSPQGIFRECLCEPIRECEEIKPVKITKINKDKFLFDFGKNFSGYVRLLVNQPEGDVITLEYAESINEDLTLNFNGMDNEIYFKRGIFAQDKVICSGKVLSWKPKFTYHGFRYVMAKGLKKACEETLTGIFVHQSVEERSHFECSNELFNKLYGMGKASTLSNMFYMPTDCPTREKLGWMNDAQASCEQFLTGFRLEKVLYKWWYDICDAMLENGALPAIVPTPGWGYTWGNGLASEGALFEIPYRIYLHTGDDSLLKKAIPYFKKCVAFWNGKAKENDMDYGLFDWAPPDRNKEYVDSKFINCVLKIKCLRIMKLAALKCGEETCEIDEWIKKDIGNVKKRYINDDGTCKVNKQTALTMLIYFGIYDDIAPLKNQLKTLIEENNFHHDCGMVGIRYLYEALCICGIYEYAYKIINAKGFPSYSYWLEDGATTLYENWNKTQSKNHHMYSHFMSWMIKTILGIKPDENYAGFKRIDVSPFFFKELKYAKGWCDTAGGKIFVAWKKNGKNIELTIEVPRGACVYYEGEKLKSGINERTILC